MQNKFFLILFAMGSLGIFAQKSAKFYNPDTDYLRALNLYNNKEFKAAEYEFRQLKNTIDDEQILGDIYYYLASISVRTGKDNADKLLTYFVQHFPNHPKKNMAYFEAADYHFTHGNLAEAQEYINKVDPGNLSREDYEKYNFYLGYTNLKHNNLKSAKRLFSKLLNSKRYGKQAKYYYGYIAYRQNDFVNAEKYFSQVEDDAGFNKKMPYYKADMYFKIGKFQDAIEQAKSIYKRSKRKEKSQLAKIIGESYFNLKKYDQAIPYLKAYRGHRGKWSNTDYYQLGYAYYKSGDYQNAIDNFNKIISGNNRIAQNAYYHLADCYLKTRQNDKALNAFKKVSEMNFDKKMQEDAFYNYAKLGYEHGNPFEDGTAVINRYLKTYPQTIYRQELEDLLVNSYLTSNNFEGAISLLEKKNETNTKTYQKAAYYRGLELLNDQDYDKAQEMFDKVLQSGFEPRYRQLSKFWKAEADYRKGNFYDAKNGFEDFAASKGVNASKENKMIDYNLGYSYFKLKNYPNSAKHFKRFIASNPKQKLLKDAYLRLGDSYFATKKYWPAMEAYNKAIAMHGSDTDYAYYQKAISYGFVGKNNKKIDDLKAFLRAYPKSKLVPDALYQLGSTYLNTNRNNKALQTFDRLLGKYSKSRYTAVVMLKQGLIYYNSGQNEQALGKFKKVVNKYPSTAVGRQAADNIKNIYIEIGRANDYAAWARNISWINVSNNELDDAVYTVAEEKYMARENQAAIRDFEKYLNQFPNGSHALKAHYYLANLYKKKADKNKTAIHYEYIANQAQNEFTTEAVRVLADLQLQKQDWAKAKPLLQRLEDISNSPDDILFAQSNLMKANYHLQDYNNSIVYAEKVLANTKSNKQMKSDAQIIIARSGMQTGDEQKARTYYAKVSKTAGGKLAAEALYFVAYFENKDLRYDASNKTIGKLTKKYASYKYWAAKSLVLMARNTYAKGDAFNATYILESVIKNFKQYADVIEEARGLLQEIKTKEAKKNSSVNE